MSKHITVVNTVHRRLVLFLPCEYRILIMNDLSPRKKSFCFPECGKMLHSVHFLLMGLTDIGKTRMYSHLSEYASAVIRRLIRFTQLELRTSDERMTLVREVVPAIYVLRFTQQQPDHFDVISSRLVKKATSIKKERT